MKIISNQADLATNLSLIIRAVPSRPTHPVLGNVLVQADAQTNQVSLIAFDLSLGVLTSFSAEVLEGGSVAIPAKLFVDIISHLPQGEITLDDQSSLHPSPDAEGLTVTLIPKSGYFQIRAIEPEDFPELPTINDSDPVRINIASLIQGLKGTLFAAGTDESKQVLTGVHLTVKGDTVEFAATDGHRLAVVETANNSLIDNQIDVTVPAKALRELQRMLVHKSASDEAINLYLDQGQVVFAWQNQRLTSRTLQGQYPAYPLLIPRQFEREFTIDRKQLIGALDRIAVLADQKNHIVKVSINGAAQEITLSCEAQDIGNGKESLPAQISGEDMDVAFNIKYLMEGLKELSSSEVQVHLNQPTTPVILKPLGGLKMTYLAMPVQLRN